MKKIDLPLILDIIFYSFATFLTSLCIMRYFRAPLWLMLTISILLCLSAGAVCFAVEYGLHRRLAVSKREQAQKDALFLHLALESHERVRALLLDAYLKDGKDAHLQGDALRVDGELYIPRFYLEPLSADEVGRLLRDYREEPFCVCCNLLSAEAERLLFAFSKKCVKGDELFFLLKRTDTYPKDLICAAPKRKGFKIKLRAAFSKKNARPFFVGGLLLLVMSLFVIFPVYYLITGAVLMATAVFVRAFGYA